MVAATPSAAGVSTPFRLDHIQRASQGKSLEVNVLVYRNNVAVAAAVASALSA